MTATGGVGAYAVQYVLNDGGTPIGVVSSATRAKLLNDMGCEAVIDRSRWLPHRRCRPDLCEPTDRRYATS